MSDTQTWTPPTGLAPARAPLDGHPRHPLDVAPPPPPEPAQRHGPACRLQPLGLGGAEQLYEIAVNSSAGATWRTRGQTIPFDVFVQFLWGGGDCAFAVLDPTGAVSGFVGLYAVDWVAGTASLSAFFDPRHPHATAVAGDALLQLCGHAFDVVGIRKLNIEMPAPVASGMLALAARHHSIRHEGTLHQQARHRGGYTDSHVFGILGDEFRVELGHLLRPGPQVIAVADPLATVVTQIEEVTASEPGTLSDVTGGWRLVEDLGLDSLAVIELIEGLEATTGATISVQTDRPLTVQSIIEQIEDRART